MDPAVQGTRYVLEACRRAGVRRVVLTSSMAAITDEPDSSQVLTEADWNTKSTIERNPYYLSKTLAEREAWSIVDEEKAGFELVVINPFAVIGPSLVRLLSHFQPKGAGSYLRSHIGRVPAYDNAKIRRELGMEFRPVRTSVQGTIDDLRRRAAVSRPPDPAIGSPCHPAVTKPAEAASYGKGIELVRFARRCYN